MAKQSAGLLMYRRSSKGVEVLLVHPGGPFWAKKDNYAWSVPKGEYTNDEDTFAAAKREFAEELGQPAPEGEYHELGQVKQAGGKLVTTWAIECDLGPVKAASNMFSIEWPPRSGQQQEFPEVDRAEWFTLSKATKKLHPGQNNFLHRLADHLNVSITEESSAAPLTKKLDDRQISLL
jgi:predicted NUDIX family NTP pyrophosphohydrolase